LLLVKEKEEEGGTVMSLPHSIESRYAIEVSSIRILAWWLALPEAVQS
jgi:hypothetical protein